MGAGSFIQVILPLRLDWQPYYRCDAEVSPGQRVSLHFSGRRYSAVVYRTGVTPDVDVSRLRSIDAVENGLEPVTAGELRFWEFLASYYMCSLGEVYKAACPEGKIKAELTGAAMLERLRTRLALRRESLGKRHTQRVRERLEQECRELEIRIARLSGPAVSETPGQAASKPVLLAGGGRTEEYIALCRAALEKGLNVLVLTPEIAAGAHLEKIFAAAFPGSVYGISSRLTPGMRRRITGDMRCSGGCIVVGTRISLFLPFCRLGLIIVDNEQDPLYKQSDPAPRYNARDAALMLGRIHGADVILGSPAPSLESCYNVASGKYGLRHTGAMLPEAEIVDISAERRKNGMVGCLSRKLIRAASGCVGPVALIRGWEKAEEVSEVCRSVLEGRHVDVLTVYEAMSGGLQDYALVAVLQADALMSPDDFRADERAVQALAVLREQCRGRFIVQTAKSEHPVFSSAPECIYPKLMEERKSFQLPPYTRLVDEYRGGVQERHVLSPDAGLAGRKRRLYEDARSFERGNGGRVHVKFDVDPV